MKRKLHQQRIKGPGSCRRGAGRLGTGQFESMGRDKGDDSRLSRDAPRGRSEVERHQARRGRRRQVLGGGTVVSTLNSGGLENVYGTAFDTNSVRIVPRVRFFSEAVGER